MKIYDLTFCDNLYLIGDIHGDFDFLMHNLKMRFNTINASMQKNIKKIEIPLMIYNNGELIIEDDNEIISVEAKTDSNMELDVQENKYKNSLFIVLGDVGFGFAKETYYYDIFPKINTMLAENNSFLLMFRGNHDDPSYFSEEKIKFSNTGG